MRALSVQAAQWIGVLPDAIPAVKRTAERIKDPLFRFFERKIVSGQKPLEQVCRFNELVTIIMYMLLL
jgi:dynein heavy chain 1